MKNNTKSAAVTECRKLGYQEAKNKWFTCKLRWRKNQPYMGNRQKHAVMMLQKNIHFVKKQSFIKNTQSLNIVESASKSNKVKPVRHFRYQEHPNYPNQTRYLENDVQKHHQSRQRLISSWKKTRISRFQKFIINKGNLINREHLLRAMKNNTKMHQ